MAAVRRSQRGTLLGATLRLALLLLLAAPPAHAEIELGSAGWDALLTATHDQDGDEVYEPPDELDQDGADVNPAPLPIDESLQVSVGPSRAATSLSATGAVAGGTLKIASQGSCSAAAQTGPVEGGIASSGLSVLFSVTEPGQYSAKGTVTVSGEARLQTPERTLVASGTHAIDFTTAIFPGDNYSVFVDCSAGAGGVSPPTSSASWNLEWTVTEGDGEEECETLAWVGDRAGAFDDPANWDLARVPLADENSGRCDGIAIRGVDNLVLDLDGPAPALGAAAAPVPIKRVKDFLVDDSRTLRPIDGTIESIAVSPVAGERSVEVIKGASLLLDGGGLFARHLAAGTLGSGSIEVATTGGYLETTGRLGLGIEGPGNLLVSDGGTVIAAEAVLGERNERGSVTVRGTASTLDTGSLAVGLEDDGALLIDAGGKVTSDVSVIDFNLSGDSRGRVTVQGKDAANNQSTWIADTLDVGPRGLLVVEDSGFVGVDGLLAIGFEGAPGDCVTGRACVKVGPSHGALFADALTVGGEGGAELWALIGESGGIAVDGVTAIGLTPQPATFRLHGSALLHPVTIAPAEHSVGTLDLRAGADLYADSLQVGTGLYSNGRVLLSRDDTSADVPVLVVTEAVATFGAPPLPNDERPLSAVLALQPGIFRSDHDLIIEATGRLDSNGGRVELDAPAKLVNRGRILGDLFLQGSYAQQAGGVLEGNLMTSPAPSPTQQLRGAAPLLLAPLAAAPPPPPFAPMVVTGDAALAGTAKLQFGNGAAPEQGDALTLLQVEGEVTGAFDTVEIAGLAPGFEYDAEVVNGALVVTAQNDGEPLPYVNLSGKPVLVETKKSAKLKLTRTGDTTQALTVAYTVAGTAESGVDFVALPGTIQLPAGKKSVTLLVQPIADGLAEATETIEIALAPNASFAPGLASALTIELQDGTK